MSARAVCSCGWTGGPYNSVARAAAMADKHVCKRDDGVRRATRRHRCARCGLEQTYENAGAVEARYWFSRHSCAKREQAMLRAALHEDRMALIDRTPKPCLHKEANHQHGERATYVLDKCRCIPCANANAEAEQWRERQKAYGRYHKYVAAEHVRAHLADLADYGIGLKRAAKLSGVSTGTLSKLVFGVYADTGTGGGRNGPGDRVRQPSRRVLRSTAEKVYAVEAIPANLGPGQADHERTPTARLHLRALVALGWSQSQLATRLGMTPTNLGPVIGTSTGGGPRRREGLRVLSRITVDKIEALYAELSMTPPTAATRFEQSGITRARKYAQDHGWLPPLALEDVDDVELDDTAPAYDEAVVLRRIDGDRSVETGRPEREEIVRRLHAQGMTDREIQTRTGISADTAMNTRRRLGLAANVHEPVVPSQAYDARRRKSRLQEAS